jgi:hypothetical protein
MKNSIIIAASVLLGCFILGILISNGISTGRFEYVSENVVFDKKTGTIYFTDKKEYRDKRGDLYRYD